MGMWNIVFSKIPNINLKISAIGIAVTKIVEIVMKKETKNIIIDIVFPAIREIFPTSEKMESYIHLQDNAKPHLA